jgi:Flp pilus assembly protein TadD
MSSSQSIPEDDGSMLRSLILSFQKTWLCCGLLALIGFAVHAPALQGQLIWDDQYLARDNPFIKSPLLALEAFRHYLFLDSFSAHYRPVQNLSFMLDYVLWNTNTFGFHLTNVLLHIGAGILLYFLLRRLLASLATPPSRIRPALLAFLLAAAWVVHPVHSAAVDYISGRADSLVFVFAAAGWILFLKSREVRGRWLGALLAFVAVAAGLLALCSRETGLIWLGLFLLYLIGFDRTSSGRTKLGVIAICFLLVGTYAGLRHLPEQRSGPAPSMGWSAPVRGMLMLRALGDYSRLMLFPANLHMERTIFNGPAFNSESAREAAVELEYLSIIGAITFLSFVAAAYWRGPARRLRIFGAAWFLIGFLPISNLFDLNATVAEHWLYLPSVGFLIFMSGCFTEFPWRRCSTIATVAFIIVLAARSFYRSDDWVDPRAFYERTAAAGGTSCRVSVNLGQIYAGAGDYARAEKIYRRILTIEPDYTIARNNLADALAHLGRQPEAERILGEATAGAHQSRKDYPRTWIAAANLARVLASRDEADSALTVLHNARRDYPDTWELLSYESELLRRKGRLDEAVAVIRPYAEKRWWHYPSWMALGRILAEKGEVAEADAALRHASWLDVRSAEPLNLIAVMRLGQNRFEDAFRAQRQAVARQPEQPRQYVLLSNILDKMGRTDEAQAALAQVSRLRSLAAAPKVVN